MNKEELLIQMNEADYLILDIDYIDGREICAHPCGDCDKVEWFEIELADLEFIQRFKGKIREACE